jgi:hypothetical protein
MDHCLRTQGRFFSEAVVVGLFFCYCCFHCYQMSLDLDHQPCQIEEFGLIWVVTHVVGSPDDVSIANFKGEEESLLLLLAWSFLTLEFV